MDRRAASSLPHLGGNKRCLLQPLRLANEIGLAFAPKHAIRLDHLLAFLARVRFRKRAYEASPCRIIGDLPQLRGSCPQVPGDFGIGSLVVRFDK